MKRTVHILFAHTLILPNIIMFIFVLVLYQTDNKNKENTMYECIFIYFAIHNCVPNSWYIYLRYLSCDGTQIY